MNARLTTTLLAALLAAPLLAADLVVDDDRRSGRHDCAGGDATLHGNHARMQLVGCTRVVLYGNFNQIDAVDAASVDVLGNDNQVGWTTSSGDPPRVSDLGSRNRVAKGLATGLARGAGPRTSTEAAGTAEADALIAQLGALELDDRIELSLGSDVLFEFNSAAIQDAARERLATLGELIRQRGRGQVLVVGHTDAIGDETANLALSRRRAQAVADWLQQHAHVEPARLRLEGRGERQPVAANTRPDGSDDPDGRARNRRVDILLATRAHVVLDGGTGVSVPSTPAVTDSRRGCAAGSTCRDDCGEGNCEMICPAGAHCFFGCSGGDCSQHCSAGAHCEFTCDGGNCQQACATGSDCRAQCEGGDCR